MARNGQELPQGTVTFAALDLTFSSIQYGQYEAWAQLCDSARDLLHSVLTRFGGVLVEDCSSTVQVVYAFSRASKAVEGVVEVLRLGSNDTNIPAAAPQIRAGIYTGETDPNGPSSLGDCVQQAIIIKNLAHWEQLLVSATSQELLRNTIGPSLSLLNLGSHRLSAAGAPEHLFQVNALGLPGDFTPLRSLDSALTNVDSPSHSLIGRDRELFEIPMQLRASRLVTLTGCSGVGKSRLAQEIAFRMLQGYADGVFLIDFGCLTNGAFIAETLATELPFVKTVGADLLAHLKAELAQRQILLVFDNCDFVQQALRTQLPELLEGARGVEILATSRQALGAGGELTYPVPPLHGPDECTKLLLERAGEHIPGFKAPADQRPIAQAICERLHGIPLCIELLACKLKVLSLPELQAQVESFSPEIAPDADQAAQQELVRRTLDWCLGSLSEAEQRFLTYVSIFTAGWEKDAALAVLKGVGFEPDDIEALTSMLVQRGIVQAVSRGPHTTRYGVCRSTWDFAFDRLVASGEEPTLRQLHLQWMVDLAESAQSELLGPRQHRWVERLDREKGNIRSAIEWCLNGGDSAEAAYKIIFGVHIFWYKRGYMSEGRMWLERLLMGSNFENSETRARGLVILSVFLSAIGDNETSISFLEHALDIANRIDAADVAAAALANLGTNHRGKRDMERARDYFAGSVAMFRKLGDEVRLAINLSNYGASLSESGIFEEARKTLTEALELNKKLDNQWAVIHVEFNLAELALRQGNTVGAEPLLANSLTRFYSLQDLRGVAKSLKSMANLADKLGQFERAAILLGASASLNERIQQDQEEIEIESHRELVDRLSRNLGEAPFFRRWSEGNNLSTDAAVTYALGRA